jgi:hypothetical protein
MAEWRSVLMKHGETFVLVSGTIVMQVWSAGSLDSLLMVSFPSMLLGRCVLAISHAPISGAIAVQSGYSSGDIPQLILNCTGLEDHVLQCPHALSLRNQRCGYAVASVVCQPAEGIILNWGYKHNITWFNSWKRKLYLRRSENWDHTKPNPGKTWGLWQWCVVFSSIHISDRHMPIIGTGYFRFATLSISHSKPTNFLTIIGSIYRINFLDHIYVPLYPYDATCLVNRRSCRYHNSEYAATSLSELGVECHIEEGIYSL